MIRKGVFAVLILIFSFVFSSNFEKFLFFFFHIKIFSVSNGPIWSAIFSSHAFKYRLYLKRTKLYDQYVAPYSITLAWQINTYHILITCSDMFCNESQEGLFLPKSHKTFTITGISIGRRMVSSAIWIKHARVSFSKSIKIARVQRTSAIGGHWKTHECLFIQISRETILLRINNMHKNVRDNCSLTKFSCFVISHCTTLTAWKCHSNIRMFC